MNSVPLTIGIVACSAEGAALCYRTICARGSKLLGQYTHPNIILHSVSLANYVDALKVADLEAVADMMLQSGRHLKNAGADFLICPDNTVHSAMHLVRQKSPLPWLHIAEVLAKEARKCGFKKVCILGTKWLVDSEVYPSALSHVGIDFLRPEPEERAEISKIIMDELVNDIQTGVSINYFQKIIEKMKVKGCDAVVLGCTEIPIIINESNSALPILDSTRLLADAALRHSMVG